MIRLESPQLSRGLFAFQDFQMDRPSPVEAAKAASADALKRAKTLTKSFEGDDQLTEWAARMIASADDFTNRRQPDPLAGFVHNR